MAVLQVILSGIGLGFSYIWSLFLLWLSIFITPLKNPNLLWILVPIWLSWFFGEFFQEKKSTSFGNAISNGVVPMWVAIDWTRLLVDQLIGKEIALTGIVYAKFAIALVVFIYGFIIIFHGIRIRGYIHYFGRIREVTYVLIVTSPVIYGAINVSWSLILAVLLFFPVFYFIIEFICRITPTPRAIAEDEEKDKIPEIGDFPSFGNSLGKEGDFLKDIPSSTRPAGKKRF